MRWILGQRPPKNPKGWIGQDGDNELGVVDPLAWFVHDKRAGAGGGECTHLRAGGLCGAAGGGAMLRDSRGRKKPNWGHG